MFREIIWKIRQTVHTFYAKLKFLFKISVAGEEYLARILKSGHVSLYNVEVYDDSWYGGKKRYKATLTFTTTDVDAMVGLRNIL